MQDFTEGNIAKQVINFSTPIMLGNVLMSVYGIINMIWVGRLLGHKAVAAISASLPIIMLMPAFLIGLGMATNILIAQAFGRALDISQSAVQRGRIQKMMLEKKAPFR
jgi:Na+-driven multidrug efflux pump